MIRYVYRYKLKLFIWYVFIMNIYGLVFEIHLKVNFTQAITTQGHFKYDAGTNRSSFVVENFSMFERVLWPKEIF